MATLGKVPHSKRERNWGVGVVVSLQKIPLKVKQILKTFNLEI
jgi:hypothetical protein